MALPPCRRGILWANGRAGRARTRTGSTGTPQQLALFLVMMPLTGRWLSSVLQPVERRHPVRLPPLIAVDTEPFLGVKTMRKPLGSLSLSAPFRANAPSSSQDRNERNHKLLNIVINDAYA
jgi:hypothetical protein